MPLSPGYKILTRLKIHQATGRLLVSSVIFISDLFEARTVTENEEYSTLCETICEIVHDL